VFEVFAIEQELPMWARHYVYKGWARAFNSSMSFSHLFYLLKGGLSLFLSRVLMEVNALNLSAWRVQG
jgi:hypothetical protein